jgi:hypothetical protein
LTDAEGLFHAIDGGPVFDKAAVRGSLGDPLNEVAPSHTMRGLSGGERWSVAIDRNGELAGVNFARVPFGKGSVVLTTLRIAESVESSGSARRVVSNVVELLKKGGPVKLEADAGAAARLDDLRERYRRRKQARGY